MDSGFDPARFVPFVLMHEFEALLFSDCARFAQAIGRPDVADSLQAIRAGFQTPEEIDDSPETAPSARIKRLVAGYDKPFMGTWRSWRSASTESGANAATSTLG